MSDILVYDDENPIASDFFRAMKQYISAFDTEAFKNKWVVAIPLKHTIEQEKLSKQFIHAHIFQHSPFYLGQYVSLTGKQAEIRDNYLFIYKGHNSNDDSEVERSCRILEDNEVYNNNDINQSYRILLLDKPVEGRYIPINTSHAGINSLHLKSNDEIESCIRTDPAASPVLSSLKTDIFFLTNCYKTSNLLASLDDIKSRIQSIIDRHTTLMIQVNPTWYQCNTSHQKRLILRCCIETFVVNRLYSMIFPPIEQKTAKDDELLASYRTWMKLQGGPTPSDVLLKPILFAPEALRNAIQSFEKLPSETSVLLKLKVLWECMRFINKDICHHIHSNYGKKMDLAADDLVPLVVLVILYSEVTELKSTISFVNEFDFSNLQERELGFCFVTFRVAVTFIEQKAKEWRDSMDRTKHSQSQEKPEWSSLIHPIKWSTFHQGDHSIIKFDPTMETYKEKQHIQDYPTVESPTRGKNSVFTQILVKDYLESSLSPEPIESPEPDSAPSYWWNSKTTTKRKVVLPWNYPVASKSPEKKSGRPRLLSRRSLGSSITSRNRTSTSSIFKNNSSEVSQEKETRRSSRCCCWGQDESIEPMSVVDQAIQDPTLPLLTNERTEVVTSTSSAPKSVDPPKPSNSSDEQSIPNVSNRQNDKNTQDFAQSRKTFPGSMKVTRRAESNQKPNYDSGMGSFLDTLKRKTDHSVSSLSWKST